MELPPVLGEHPGLNDSPRIQFAPPFTEKTTMRLLVLSHFYPLPANNGTKMRTWALLRALAAEGHDVTLLTFADPHEADGREAELRQVCNQVECLPWPLPSLSSSRKHAARLKAILSPLPYGVLRFQSEAMKQAVLGLLQWH